MVVYVCTADPEVSWASHIAPCSYQNSIRPSFQIYEIRHWIWADSSYHEELDPEWRLLCQLENGLYALYVANTTTTDFAGCWGDMFLYLAPDPESLVFFAMGDYTYSLYEQATLPAPSWNSWDAATVKRRLAWAMLGQERLGSAAQPWAAAVGADSDALGAVGRRVFAAMQRELLDDSNVEDEPSEDELSYEDEYRFSRRWQRSLYRSDHDDSDLE